MTIKGRRGLTIKLSPVLPDDAKAAAWIGVRCWLGEPRECAATIKADELRRLKDDQSETAILRKADLMVDAGEVDKAVSEYWKLALEGKALEVRMTAVVSIAVVYIVGVETS
jgi:hypothetical protein